MHRHASVSLGILKLDLWVMNCQFWRVGGQSRAQIREQMLVPDILWYEKSIMAWFGQLDHTCEKKVWGRLWATFGSVFLYFHGQKINLNFFWKSCIVRTEKLHWIKVKKKFGKYFLQGKNQFFRAKNLSVSTKTLWSVLCLLLLCFTNKCLEKYGVILHEMTSLCDTWNANFNERFNLLYWQS